MTGPSADDPRAVRRAALRKATLQLVLGVVALDALALGIYYLGGIEHGSTPTKQIFSGVWLVATAVTVAVLLRRVRTIRFNR
jgi:hypothetical protein